MKSSTEVVAVGLRVFTSASLTAMGVAPDPRRGPRSTTNTAKNICVEGYWIPRLPFKPLRYSHWWPARPRRLWGFHNRPAARVKICSGQRNSCGQDRQDGWYSSRSGSLWLVICLFLQFCVIEELEELYQSTDLRVPQNTKIENKHLEPPLTQTSTRASTSGQKEWGFFPIFSSHVFWDKLDRLDWPYRLRVVSIWCKM